MKRYFIIIALFLLTSCNIESGVNFSGFSQSEGKVVIGQNIVVTDLQSGKKYAYTDPNDIRNLTYIFRTTGYGVDPRGVPAEDELDFKVRLFNIELPYDTLFIYIDDRNGPFVYIPGEHIYYNLQSSAERRLKVYEFYPD